MSRQERHAQIQAVLAQYKATKRFLEEKLETANISVDGEIMKEELLIQLKAVKAERDQRVIEFKMIEGQHLDALKLFR